MSHMITGPVYKPNVQGQNPKVHCSRCRGQGFIFINSSTVSLCPCREKSKSKTALLGPALLDPAELGCTFSNYFWTDADSKAMPIGPGLTKENMGQGQAVHKHKNFQEPYKVLYNEALFYARKFSLLRNTPLSSLGLLDRGSFYSRAGASAPNKTELAAARQHLLGAVAQHLSQAGFSVLMVEDSFLMSSLQCSAREKGGRRLPEILKLLKDAEILIWQDLGRSRMGPGSRSHYLEIFSHRRRKNLPMCFSSIYTPALLQHRLGSQSACSLLSMCIGGLHASALS